MWVLHRSIVQGRSTLPRGSEPLTALTRADQCRCSPMGCCRTTRENSVRTLGEGGGGSSGTTKPAISFSIIAVSEPRTRPQSLKHQRSTLTRNDTVGEHSLIVISFSDMIHASSSNRDPSGHIRLSVDLRFADRDRPHDARWDRSARLGSVSLMTRLTSALGDRLPLTTGCNESGSVMNNTDEATREAKCAVIAWSSRRSEMQCK